MQGTGPGTCYLGATLQARAARVGNATSRAGLPLWLQRLSLLGIANDYDTAVKGKKLCVRFKILDCQLRRP
jgi:hypothetical protein